VSTFPSSPSSWFHFPCRRIPQNTPRYVETPRNARKWGERRKLLLKTLLHFLVTNCCHSMTKRTICDDYVVLRETRKKKGSGCLLNWTVDRSTSK
jgi:hypothetical protein